MPSSDAPWRLTYEIGYIISRTEIKRTPCLQASPGRGAKRWQTSSIDTPGRRVTLQLTAESVSVPYSNPMFDVPDVSRFCRCSISDVHIGRSLVDSIGQNNRPMR